MAASNCAKNNLSLLSIPSALEWQCLAKANSGKQINFLKSKKAGFFNVALRATGASFWTSGSNEGEFCNSLNVYSWCSLNKTLLQPEFLASGGGASYWKNTTAANSEADRCLIYKLNETVSENTGFEHAPYSANNFYICEVFFTTQGKIFNV